MNIKEHKWSDDTLSYTSNHNDELQLSNASEWPLSLDKSDAIAIANHFNLIPETENPHYDVVDGKVSTKTPLSVESLESVMKVVK